MWSLDVNLFTSALALSYVALLPVAINYSRAVRGWSVFGAFIIAWVLSPLTTILWVWVVGEKTDNKEYETQGKITATIVAIYFNLFKVFSIYFIATA